jgi:drug/metabolite transporter (DMT)-like permease
MPPATSLARRLAALPPGLRGALWMIAAAAAFAGMAGTIRLVADRLHPFEVAFFRSFFGLLWMAPWILRVGLGALRTQRIGLYLLRTVASGGSMLAQFTALALMPLADAVALNFTFPLFATMTAAAFLGERVSRAQWLATAIGFLGVVTIMRPGFHALSPAYFLPLLAAALSAWSAVSVKTLSRTESANAIVTYMTLLMTPALLVPALFVWTMPDLGSLGWLALVGAFGTLGHLTLTRAFAATDASAVIPFDFFRLPFVAAIGFLVFGERPDLWTWIGAAIIVGSTVEVARRQPRRAGAPARS